MSPQNSDSALSPLLRSDESESDQSSDTQEETSIKQNTRGISAVLPLAFLGSLGMAATNATTISAYAALSCEDPKNCSTSEEQRYQRILAASVSVNNICGLLVLGLLPFLARLHVKASLYFWLACRASSIAALALAVRFQLVWIALLGRVFEGFAKDTVFQFAMNVVFVRLPEQADVDRHFGISLALYMVGQALSPIISGLFSNFQVSFYIGGTLLVLCIVYLYAGVPLENSPHLRDKASKVDTLLEQGEKNNITNIIRSFARRTLEPLSVCFEEPCILSPALATFAYFTSISYVYPAIMVFAVVRFKFTGAENGWLISTAAGVSGIYLLVVHYVLPWYFMRQKQKPAANLHKNRIRFEPQLWYAVSAMSLFVAAMPWAGAVTNGAHLFPIVAVASLALSAPSFIRSYAVSMTQDGTKALALTTLMETLGALCSPIVLGAAQSSSRSGIVFVVSASFNGVGIIILLLGATIMSSLRRQHHVRDAPDTSEA